MGQILLAGEEPHERPASVRDVAADGAAQHRVDGLESVENRTLRRRTLHPHLYLFADARQRPQMLGEHDPDHGSV
jgi:hypothetical protein